MTWNKSHPDRPGQHLPFMRVLLCLIGFAITAPVPCHAQKWELGGTGGYGWYINPSISNATGSIEAGFPPKGTVGAVFGNNMYEHVGGEIRYLFRFGGPELQSGGLQANKSGYTNLIVYDLLIHMTSRDERLRPFIAGGAGIKVYTGTGIPSADQPLSDFARLTTHTQVEPAISAGAGLKYRLTRHAQVRIDFRTYFSPLPEEIFRTRGFSSVHGWVYDFVPMAGLSYVF
jgi:hypothetical protein